MHATPSCPPTKIAQVCRGETPTSFTGQSLAEANTAALHCRSKNKVSTIFHFRPVYVCLRQLPIILLVDNDSQDVGSADADENSSLMSGPGDISVEDDARIHGTHHSHRPDITGLALLLKIEFWQLWPLLGVLTGVGLMTIK